MTRSGALSVSRPRTCSQQRQRTQHVIGLVSRPARSWEGSSGGAIGPRCRSRRIVPSHPRRRALRHADKVVGMDRRGVFGSLLPATGPAAQDCDGGCTRAHEGGDPAVASPQRRLERVPWLPAASSPSPRVTGYGIGPREGQSSAHRRGAGNGPGTSPCRQILTPHRACSLGATMRS